MSQYEEGRAQASPVTTDSCSVSECTPGTKSKKAEPKRNRGYASWHSLDVLHRNYARGAQDATQWKAVGSGENDAKSSEAAPNITVSLATIDLSYSLAESVVSQRALMLRRVERAFVWPTTA